EMKGVAGMVRSFSYAGQVALVRHTNRRANEFQNLVGFGQQWERETSSLFVKTYREAMTDARLLPAANDLAMLLDIFNLERALHELQYEINNRPQWIHIPLHALLSILEGPAVE